MAALPPSAEILVIGAGPAGLAAALALQKNGCKNLVIVDALAAGENTSRAIAVHAATLEALEEIGCADNLVKRGVIVNNGGNMWDGYRFHRSGDFSVLKPHTKYPYILFCPQHVTEKVLGERCKEQGINVLRPVRVADLKVNADNPDYTDVIFEDGHVLKAHYIVGADGSKSLVRSIAGITYVDPDGEDPASEDVKAGIVADVVFASPPPTKPNEPLFVLTNGNFSLTLPLPPAEYGGEQAWRIATGVPVGAPPHAPPLEYLQGLIDAYGPSAIPISAVENKTPLKIARVIWSTRFRTDSAISSTPFTRLGNGAGGVITLIGDAAHKHPPTGGQGLNLGIRDAIFLGPVLAAHSAKMAQGGSRTEADKPLQAWADTRHERALTVIRLAKRGLRMLTWRDETVWYFGIIPVNWVKVRNFGFWFMGVTGIMRRVQPWELSGLRNR